MLSVTGVIDTYASSGRLPGANVSVASPEVTVPPWADVISTEPEGGGPRPLPGTAAGSVADGSTLVSAVAPSDGGGAIESEAAVEGEAVPPGLAVAGVVEIVAAMLGEVSEPDTICGAAAVAGADEIVVGAAGAVALTSKVGAADALAASIVAVVVVTMVVGTLTV